MPEYQHISAILAGRKGPGDCVNSPGVWPHLYERSDVTNASAHPLGGGA